MALQVGICMSLSHLLPTLASEALVLSLAVGTWVSHLTLLILALLVWFHKQVQRVRRGGQQPPMARMAVCSVYPSAHHLSGELGVTHSWFLSFFH